MKLKKFLVIIISLLCFAGLAVTLSKQQSQRADQVLTNNGLSSPYYKFSTKRKVTIKSFLKHINKKYQKQHLQIHFKNKFDESRILIWANYNLKSQPMAKGNSRYFNKSDFTGKIPFAVISAETNKNLVTLQGNRYVKEGSKYYSVIGQLKQNNESPNGQTAYYLTTGIEQPTANERLNNFKIIIDGLNKRDLNQLQSYLRGNVQTIDYAKTYNRQHGISPTKKLLLALFCVVLALIDSAIWALLDSVPLKKIYFKNEILSRLLTSSGVRCIFIDLLLLLITYFVFPIFLFYSDRLELFKLLAFVYLMQVFTFAGVIFLMRGRKKKND